MMTMKAWGLKTWEVQDEEVEYGMHAEFAVYGGIGGTAQVLLVQVRWQSHGGWRGDELRAIFGPLCQTQGWGGEGGRRRGESSQVLGHCTAN